MITPCAWILRLVKVFDVIVLLRSVELQLQMVVQHAWKRLVRVLHVQMVLHAVKRRRMMDMCAVAETRIILTKLGMVRVSNVRRVTVRILISSRVDCTVHVRISVRIKELNVDARTVTME